MDRVIGGVLGLAAFTAVVVLSLMHGLALKDCVLRAFLALVLGYLVGRLIFGKVGLSIAKEAAGRAEQPKPAEKQTTESAENTEKKPETKK